MISLATHQKFVTIRNKVLWQLIIVFTIPTQYHDSRGGSHLNSTVAEKNSYQILIISTIITIISVPAYKAVNSPAGKQSSFKFLSKA